jgi:hypothetical protein
VGSPDYGEAVLGDAIIGGKEDRPIRRSHCESGDAELCSKERRWSRVACMANRAEVSYRRQNASGEVRRRWRKWSSAQFFPLKMERETRSGRVGRGEAWTVRG